jgi:effector-binding domain-containing protein
MDYAFEVTDAVARPTLAIRTHTSVATIGQVMGQAFGTVYQYVMEIGAQAADAAYVAYYNMDPNDFEVDIGFIMTEAVPGRGDVHADEIPAGRQVSCMYQGPYDQMEPLYKAMSDWMSANNYVPSGTVYELYYNDPSQVPPSELLTKVIFPVKE